MKRKIFKRILIGALLIIIIPSLLLFTFKTVRHVGEVKGRSTENKPVQTPKKEEAKLKRYYVAVSHLANPKTNTSKSELVSLATSGKIMTTDGTGEDLQKFLGVEKISSVPAADQIKLSKENYAVLKVEELNPPLKVLKVDGKLIWEDEDYPLWDFVVKKAGEQPFDLKERTELVAVGNINYGRTVLGKINEKGALASFSEISDYLSSADVTIGSLDSVVALVPGSGKNILEGLEGAGFDILSVASNKLTLSGSKAFRDTLANITDNKMDYVGGGESEADAASYKVIKNRNHGFAFISFNILAGGLAAKDETAGVYHMITDRTLNIDSSQKDDISLLIANAKKESDYLIAYINVSKDSRDPSTEAKNVAHSLAEMGADLIICGNSSISGGVEYYKNKFIDYGLGNFISDTWLQTGRQGIILKAIFYKEKLASVVLSPISIIDQYKPVFASEKDAKNILDAIWASSGRISKEF
ncbi:MAG: Capsule synthesis protein, CapA [candidate division CPR2 bacterium GW2011_GWC1_39_9]|nr:MAG: Capsule synthesis protein, CapA [candidate division CPR2 bacterium GW2011_GWC1_39_9]